MVPKITPFAKGFFAFSLHSAISFCPKQLVQAMLRKDVSMPVKSSDLNLPPTSIRYLKENSISLVRILANRTQETLQNSVNFTIVHIPEANAQLMEKFIMFARSLLPTCW